MSNDLGKLIENAERALFDEWLAKHPNLQPKDDWWVVWNARGALASKCRGIKHQGCNYLGVCGQICSKCGQQV